MHVGAPLRTGLGGTAPRHIRHEGPGLLVVRPTGDHYRPRSCRGPRRHQWPGQPGTRLLAV